MKNVSDMPMKTTSSELRQPLGDVQRIIRMFRSQRLEMAGSRRPRRLRQLFGYFAAGFSLTIM